MKYFRTEDREAGNLIKKFSSVEDAENAVSKYEEEDKTNGCYTPNFYDVCVVEIPTVSELINSCDYYPHHSAYYRGYVSRRGNGIVKEYKGRFGEGYALLTPRWDTSNYCTITYYIKK